MDDPELARSAQRVVALAGARAVTAPASAAATAWGTVAGVVVDAGSVSVLGAVPRRAGVVLVTAADPAPAVWRAAVGLGAEAVWQLPAQEAALLDWVVVLGSAPSTGRLLRCMPARGGSGASTLAGAVALAAAGSMRVLLVDGDAAGGGIDLLLGIESEAGSRWAQFAEAAGTLRAESLTATLPAVGTAAVLSFAPGDPPLQPPALESVVTTARRLYDLVVLDLPAGYPDDVTDVPGLTLLVVPAEVRAVTAAAAEVRRQVSHGRQVRLVVRTPGPGDLRPRHVAEAVGAPVVAEWKWQRRLDADVDRGRFVDAARRSSLGEVAHRVLDAVAVDAAA